MSDYPSTSPFGPHGPQTNGYSVTPNPTAQSSFANIGGDSFGGYAQPSGGGGYVGGSGYVGGGTYVPAGPRTKLTVIGVILAWVLGPIGMIYAVTRTSRVHWIAFLLYTVFYTYVMVATDEARPIWITFAFINALWAGIAIRRLNKRLKREWDDEHATA